MAFEAIARHRVDSGTQEATSAGALTIQCGEVDEDAWVLERISIFSNTTTGVCQLFIGASDQSQQTYDSTSIAPWSDVFECEDPGPWAGSGESFWLVYSGLTPGALCTARFWYHTEQGVFKA